LSREIDEELKAHIAEVIEQGRDPVEARKAFGGALRTREECRDFRVLARLDSLRADTVFAWRQFLKHKVTSAAAMLSLALAIGACTSAFRLIDAILLRPLPVAAPEQLYSVLRQVTNPADARQHMTSEVWAYPDFQLMRDAAKGQAELLAVSSPVVPTDLTYKSDAEVEKAYVQYVSGWMFDSFGLRLAAGRLLNADDDSKPRVHPYAVLSYEYWTRRFGRDPKAVGRTFQMGRDFFQIIGVGPEAFTGTETGTVTDVFLPTMMHPGVTHDDWTWHRTLARVRPGVAIEPLRAKLEATSRAFERERSKGFHMPREIIEVFLNQKVFLEPAAAGASGLRDEYRTALAAMGVLVGLVLLIACANVANLMTAQAAARAREMALRVSIGAGRGRLVQLVLVESAWLAAASAALGAWLAWWSAPLVVSRINPPDHPVRLALPADWRVLAFGIALTLAVTLLFGLAPALRASNVNPASALRGGASSPHGRRRLMHTLIAAQVAFCFVVLFVAGLFAATFNHLLHRPLGFSADRVLTLDAVSEGDRPAVFWEQAADRLRDVPGVESVALAAWPLLSDHSWNGFVSVNGAPPGPADAEFMKVSPGWLDTMKLLLVAGRDFRPDDSLPGSAIVNETFVRLVLNGLRPIGVEIAKDSQSFRIVGVVRDTPYRDIHEDIRPVVFVPFHSAQPTREATFVVRTASANPLAMASSLRRAVTSARVTNIRPQIEFVQAQTVRERLMAMLALFFAAVALVLAAIGLYGVLDYSVLQRRREIGIRIAIGAQSGEIARRVTADVFRTVVAGAIVGFGLGMLTVRYIAALLYQVRPGDPAMLALPAAIILGATLVAALPAVYHAIRIDPVAMLRAD
jgi:predicted permease